MHLRTKRLILRPLKRSDVPALVTICNDLDVARGFLVAPFPFRALDALRWVRRNQYHWKKRMHDIYSFGIQLHHSNTLIGSAALSSIDTYSKLAKISYQIGKQHWGNGYATEAVQALLTFGFRRLKLRRIECSVFTDNARSIRVLKNLGFRREGWRQQSRRSIADGKLRDEYMYALLRTQWKQS